MEQFLRQPEQACLLQFLKARYQTRSISRITKDVCDMHWRTSQKRRKDVYDYDLVLHGRETEAHVQHIGSTASWKSKRSFDSSYATRHPPSSRSSLTTTTTATT
eukprot:3116784-Pyramimonas_sp.AAC.1